MLRGLRNRLTYANVVATIALFAAVGGGTFAIARVPRGGNDGPIDACYKARGRDAGDVRLLLRGTRCRRGERKVTWNTRGRQGLTGPAGAPGVPGTPGADGATGPQGPAGTARAHVRVRPATCTVIPSDCALERARGVSQVRRVGTGSYCIVAPGIDGRLVPAAASVDFWHTASPEGDASAMAMSADETTLDCPQDATSFAVVTERQGSAVVSGTQVSTPAQSAGNVAFTVVIP